MNWRRLNPWLRLADLYREMDRLEYRIRETEREAYRRAGLHFDRETAYLRQHNTYLLGALATIHELKPMSVILPLCDIER